MAERRNRKLTLDKATFGITGILALAFVAWGFLSTESLGSASATALDWTVTNTGWLFVVLASALFWMVLVVLGTIVVLYVASVSLYAVHWRRHGPRRRT